MKIVIVGTNHAGIAAANTLLDQYPQAEVVMINKDDNLSYLGCGTALYIGRQIPSQDGLFYTKAQDFIDKGAKIMMETTVEEIDYDNKLVKAINKKGQAIEETYDKLLLVTGSKPIVPNLPGKDLEGISLVKSFENSKVIDKALDNEAIQTVGVIGAGYIGVELAEAARRRGKNVLLFDAQDRTLPNYYDPQFSHLMDKNLEENGLELHFNEFAEEYLGNDQGHVSGIKTNKGEYQVDFVLNAIGFRANAELAGDHLDLAPNGAILVDSHQQTSDPDVYAAGDCATIYSNALQETTHIALASNAVRTGLVAGHNLGGNPITHPGAQGSNGIHIFGLKMVSTGLTVEAACKAGMVVEHVDYTDTQFPGFIPDNEEVTLRIVYDFESRRILGAQLASRYDVSMMIHMFSLAVQKEMTIDELALFDTFFLPHFNQPYNYITMAALQAGQAEVIAKEKVEIGQI